MLCFAVLILKVPGKLASVFSGSFAGSDLETVTTQVRLPLKLQLRAEPYRVPSENLAAVAELKGFGGSISAGKGAAGRISAVPSGSRMTPKINPRFNSPKQAQDRPRDNDSASRNIKAGACSAPDKYVSALRGARVLFHEGYAAAKVWRRVAFGSMACSLICGLGATASALRPPPKPEIIEVDTNGGGVRFLGAAGRSLEVYQPGQTVLRATLSRWIENVRSVSTDEAVVRASNRAPTVVTRRAPHARQLRGRHNPFELQLDRRISVEIVGVPRQGTPGKSIGPETTYAHSGQTLSTERWWPC